MIIIPDIHINTKQSTAILAKLEEIFRNHDDKEVLFLGDYVYMFSYDRASLIWLYNILLQLYAEWRTVRVMSWNHDRIAGHFIYDEVQKAFQIMNNHKLQSKWKLEFITQIAFRADESNNLHVILPFNDHLEQPSESDYYTSSLLWSSEAIQLLSEIAILKNAKNLNEQFSALLNEIALTIYETNKNIFKHIYIYHHYYTANTTFPGVQSIFHFKDKALSPLLLDLPWLTLVSGHIHEPFVYKNYICAGSFRNTSWGEINEIKWIIVWKPSAFRYISHWINPKFVLNFDQHKTIDHYMNEINDIIDACASRLQGNGLVVESIELPPSHLMDMVLQFSWTTPVPSDIEHIANQVHILQVQKKKEKLAQTDTLLQPENADYVNELQSRKLLLENFLDVKYADQKDGLMDFLDQYKLLQ